MPFRVYSLGSNGSGQLGLGHTDDVAHPQPCRFLSEELTARPCKISAGGNHTLMLCEDGSLFATGENNNGRCAVQTTGSLTDFKRVVFWTPEGQLIDKFLDCSATWEASTLVTVESKVYTCGTGFKGELGHGDHLSHCSSPRLILDFPPAGVHIASLAACMSHTVAVLSNGEVYGWGAGRQGQLGHPLQIAWAPRKILAPSFSVIRATCGREFTCLIGSAINGGIAIIGSNKWSVKTSSPESIVGWRAVHASWGGVHVLFESGIVLGWGRNDHGQHPPPNLECPLKQIAVGSEHALAIRRDGEVLAWGWGEHGNCGDLKKDAVSAYNQIASDVRLSVLGAGCATSWLLCDTFAQGES